MIPKSQFFIGAALLLLLPTPVMAGGPPWLCLPIDGVTDDNVQACVDLVSAKLESKLWPHDGPYRDVRLERGRDQWYLTFGIGKDVRLSDVEAALKGSGFSIPRDKLRLFGHVIAEIDAPRTLHRALLADLEALDHASITASDAKEDVLLVTVKLPYPATDGRPKRNSAGWDTFRRNDYSAEQSTKPEPTITSAMLPGYDSFHDIAAKHRCNLKDIRWSIEFPCRALGAVALPDTASKLGKTVQAAVPLDQ